MKSKIRSLLGIEMSLNNREFKPIILLIGVLFFVMLSIPLGLSLLYYKIKFTLLNTIDTIKKERKMYYKGKFKWFWL